MPNNFKLTGNYYVSKAGNDANAGTSADAPKRTVQAALNAMTVSGQTLIVGAGVYNETLSKTTNNFSITIKGDGYVVFDGIRLFPSSITLLNSLGTAIVDGIEIRNYDSITGPANSTSVVLQNCVIKNSWFYASGALNLHTRNKWINCNISFGGAATNSFEYNIFINTKIGISGGGSYTLTSGYLRNCYMDPTSYVQMSSAITAANFNFNNIRGGIGFNAASSVTSGVITDIIGNYVDLSLAGNGGTGTQLDPYRRSDTLSRLFYLSGSRVAYPTYNPSSSAVDPKFNSIEDQDFTLQADSWHIRRASDGISNIGDTNYALRRQSNSDSFSGSSATVDPSLIFQYNNYIISGSQVTGSITSAPIAVSPLSSSKVIQKVTYNGLLAFNKDTGSASGSNQNVPDFDTFTSASGNAGANPDRLVYYMRHTTGSSIPVSDAGWDNGGLWTAGQYNVFEWNTKPSIDNLGVGNGSGSFNAAASPTYIQATYVQMQVKLRNDYLL